MHKLDIHAAASQGHSRVPLDARSCANPTNSAICILLTERHLNAVCRQPEDHSRITRMFSSNQMQHTCRCWSPASAR